MNTLVLSPSDRVYRRQYASLEDAAHAAKFDPSGMLTTNRASRDVGNAGWTGSDSFDEAYNWAMLGWPNGHKLLELHRDIVPANLLERLLPAEEFATKWEHGVTGSSIDMSRAALDIGAEHFLTEVEDDLGVRRGKNVQRIVVNACNNADISAEMFCARGILAYSTVDHLEKLGYSIELSVEITITNWERSAFFTTVIKLKDFGETMNVDRLMFALSSAAMLRRIWFGIAETLPNHLRRLFSIPGGYGKTVGIATRQKPSTLCLDLHSATNVERLVEQFSKQLTEHYINNDINFAEDQ